MTGAGQRPIQRSHQRSRIFDGLPEDMNTASFRRPRWIGKPGSPDHRVMEHAPVERAESGPGEEGITRGGGRAKPPCGGSGGSVSRVLSWDVIPLGWMSPSNSSDLPAGSVGSTLAACAVRRPIWSCSLGGLPCPSCCQSGGGLLPHRFTLACDPKIHRRSALCCTFRRVAPPWCYQAQHPVEPGLSSALASSDALIHKGEASTI